MVKIGKSARLNYKLMDENDAQLLFELDQDVEVMRFINGGKLSSWQHINDNFIPRLISYRNATNGWGLWQINLTESNQFIGWILVRPMDFFSEHPKWRNIELGWRLKQLAWGKGYATEAAQHIQQTLTEQTNVSHFSALAVQENIGSIRIMKKLGMCHIKSEVNKGPLGEMQVVHYQVSVNL